MKTKKTLTPSNAGLRSYLSYLARHKLPVAVVAAGFVVANISLAVMPFAIGDLTGALAARPIRGHEAIMLMWLLIGLSVAHSILWHGSELLYLRWLKPIGYTYENVLFRRVVQQPYPYFVDKFTGKISSYITTLSKELREFTDNIFYNYIGQAIGILSLIVIMAAINWQTGVIFCVGLIGMVIAGRHTIGAASRYERIEADVMATKNGKLIDAIANFVTIKAFRKELVELQTIEAEQQRVIASGNRAFVAGLIFWATMSLFVREFIWPASIGLNVFLFLHHNLSVAQLSTLLSAVLIFSTTVWGAVWYISQFTLQAARIEEAHQYLFGQKNIIAEAAGEPKAPAAPTPPFERSFAFNALSFAYPDKPDTPVLVNINLQIAKGEKIGIVGASGSGKTTLTKLLLGYYPVPASQLLLDGAPAGNTSVPQLISYVPQDTTLFHRSIAENISYAADRSVSREEVILAAKHAHADEFIRGITDGYDALVGERGVKLSTGQRQRIAIARAFLDDKPVLILDEATSALDSESEVLVQQALEALWQDKTVIAIAHRLSTLRHMDRIVVLDKGTIAEIGSHRELLTAGGGYAKLWAHQSGGFIEE